MKSNLDSLRNASRQYKKSIKIAIRKYGDFNKKLRGLRSSNPKEFWSLLCTNDRKDKANNIKLDYLS